MQYLRLYFCNISLCIQWIYSVSMFHVRVTVDRSLDSTDQCGDDAPSQARALPSWLRAWHFANFPQSDF
jgi:hypothetical protein